MNDQVSEVQPPEGFRNGFTIEHVLLSVTIVSTKDSAGQFDDSCAGILQRELMTYHGVEGVTAEVLYAHTKIENHIDGCECGKCAIPKAHRSSVTESTGPTSPAVAGETPAGAVLLR